MLSNIYINCMGDHRRIFSLCTFSLVQSFECAAVLNCSIKLLVVYLKSDERRGKLKLSTRYRVLMLAFLVILATFATFYTLAAYRVASMWACGGGAAYWCCMGSIDNATFFPVA